MCVCACGWVKEEKRGPHNVGGFVVCGCVGGSELFLLPLCPFGLAAEALSYLCVFLMPNVSHQITTHTHTLTTATHTHTHTRTQNSRATKKTLIQ